MNHSFRSKAVLTTACVLLYIVVYTNRGTPIWTPNTERLYLGSPECYLDHEHWRSCCHRCWCLLSFHSVRSWTRISAGIRATFYVVCAATMARSTASTPVPLRPSPTWLQPAPLPPPGTTQPPTPQRFSNQARCRHDRGRDCLTTPRPKVRGRPITATIRTVGILRIMEKQMEKQMENEMETRGL